MTLIIIGIVLLIYVNYLYMRSEHYRNTLGGAQNFRKVPSDLEIVNIGSGPGLYAISYDECSRKGFNFSTAPQNYKYGFRILRHFSDKLNDGCIIIIIMCPLSFGNNQEYKNKNYSDKFYGILSSDEIDNYSGKRAIMLRFPLLKYIAAKLKKKKMNKNTISSLECPEIINIWKKEFELNDLTDEKQAEDHKEAFEEKIHVISDGIKFCCEKGFRPMFVLPPVPKKTREYIGKKFLQVFVYENLKILNQRFPNVPMLDYYGDERFTKKYFLDDIFMNETGKKVFSDILFNDIDLIFKED